MQKRVATHGAQTIDVAPDLFDSDLLGLRIGRIVAVKAGTAAEYHDLFARAATRALGDGYQQLLRRTRLSSLAEIWGLERAGFELMDVGVTFARGIAAPIPMPAHGRLIVRASTDQDLEAIVGAMVAEPWGSRYEADPAYLPSRVSELRARWLWNSHRGRADIVLVGVIDGAPAGYVTCRLDRDGGPGDIELVGTLPAFRGRGVAAAVLASAVAWFSTRTRSVTIRTQATNTAAAALYERAGFTLRGADLTFRLALTSTDPKRDCS